VERRVPASLILSEAHVVEGDIVSAKTAFYNLARRRVKYRNQSDYHGAYKAITGENNIGSPAFFALLSTTVGRKDVDYKRRIEGLEINV
jgi:hypothetical protein